MKTFAVTGHRPNKLGGYGVDVMKMLTNHACTQLALYHPNRVITGMAQGWDQAIARACILMNVPFIAAVPFIGQECMWPDHQQYIYRRILDRAQSVEIVSPGEYTVQKMQIRNEWMVDHCDTLLALWNGTAGGTKNCVDYAASLEKHIINCWTEYAIQLKQKQM